MKINDLLGALPIGKKEEKSEKVKALTTVWGETLDPENVWQEYPRPRLVRGGCTMLNGYWKYAVTKSKRRPDQFDGRILVPFSPESALSGVSVTLMPDEFLWYEREVGLKELRGGQRCILHFGAVDQCAVVYIDGQKAARHVGGYLPFSVDITPFIKLKKDSFVITVRVQDYTDTSYHSRGKQKLKPGGMYYTAQSGIWQSVWMETVPERFIEDVYFEAEALLESVRAEISIDSGSSLNEGAGAGGKSASNICIRVYEPTKNYHAEDRPQGLPVLEVATDKFSLSLKIPDAKLWNPGNPWIYPVEIEFGDDLVQSYFAVRRFTTGADKNGVTRLLLNGEPVFMNGVLDQGYWPDGLYTAPSDEALIYDITRMKALGFNMLRKHAKIENPRYYYHCDRLGMIVWQDMVNGGGDYSALLLTYIPTGICVPGPSKKKPGAAKKSSKIIKKLEYGVTGRKSIAGRREFIKECESTVKLLRGHPSVAAWVIFNEGWGQFDTAELTEYIKELDPGRFVDSASGWFESKAGDIKSVHNYFRKQSVPLDVRAKVISEYGGLVLRVDGHSMHESTYGYHTCKNAREFRRDFRRLLDEEILPLEAEGLCGAVYTQVSDIEEETNGLLTYDRKVCKIVLANTSHI